MSSEILELNASDLRDREKLEQIMKPATQQQSLFGKKGKIILIDEIDGITTDRGGLPELIALIEKTHFPIIITANNIWQQKFALLRRKVEMIKLKEIKYELVLKILQSITKKEKKEIDENLLKTIAAKSRGDIRAALNDLQTVIYLEKETEVKEIMKEKKKKISFKF